MPTLCFNTKSVLSAPLSLLIKAVSKSSTWSKCGSHPTVLSVTCWTVQSSVSPLSSQIFLVSCQAGLIQLWWEDTLSATSIVVKTVLLRSQALLSLCSLLLMAQTRLVNSCTLLTIKILLVATWACSIQRSRSAPSPNHACLSLSLVACLSNSPPKTLFWRSTTVCSWTFSKKNTIRTSAHNSKKKTLIMSTDWLMILSLRLLRAVVTLCGLVKTMMVMFSPILLLKVSALLVSWHLFVLTHQVFCRLKLLTALLLATTVSGRRVVQPLLTLSLQSSLGLVVSYTERNWTKMRNLLSSPKLLKAPLLLLLKTVKWPKILLS